MGEDETAHSQRDAAHNVNISAVWTEDDVEGERHVAWAREFFSAVQPHADGRVYLNFLGDEGADRVRQAYGAWQYERLAASKRTYDPTNFFRMTRTSRGQLRVTATHVHKKPGRGPRTAPSLDSNGALGVAELALSGLEHAGSVLVLALVSADRLDPCLVAVGQGSTDFLHT